MFRRTPVRNPQPISDAGVVSAALIVELQSKVRELQRTTDALIRTASTPSEGGAGGASS